jgi:hypothetical protein
MKDQKSVKTRRYYDAGFRQDIIRMLGSGKIAREDWRLLELPRMFYIVGEEWQQEDKGE